jgi:cytochrome c
VLSPRTALPLVLGSLAILAGGSAASGAPAPDFRALLFTATAGYRHDSIPAAITAIEQLGAQNDFAVDATEDAGAFTTANLSRYAVVMFVLTTGDVLDADQQAALQRYIEGGGAFVGVHSASDTELDWPWYTGLVGALFVNHSAIVPATVDVVDHDTPSTVHLPAHWNRTDEWYAFQTQPASSVTVLTTVDESTYDATGATMGADHPISWQQVYDGGRSWYTAMGHTSTTYAEPLFLRFLLGGILWAAGYDLPKVHSVSTTVAGRRLHVTSTHSRCLQCTERVTVHAVGRVVTARVPADGTRTQLTTRTLPPGRWRYTIVLDDLRMKAHDTARGAVRVT